MFDSFLMIIQVARGLVAAKDLRTLSEASRSSHASQPKSSNSKTTEPKPLNHPKMKNGENVPVFVKFSSRKTARAFIMLDIIYYCGLEIALNQQMTQTNEPTLRP